MLVASHKHWCVLDTKRAELYGCSCCKQAKIGLKWLFAECCHKVFQEYLLESFHSQCCGLYDDMKWCGGVEWKGRVVSSGVLPDMHVSLCKGPGCANSTDLSMKVVFAIGYCS